MKTRLDKLLVDRGLTPSRERAHAMILAGKVLVNEQKVDKAGAAVDSAADLRLLGEDLRYVSRGGLKLEKALEHWQIDLREKMCLDIGASTGGFSDCMLQHGAAKVIAVDTGYGQMEFALRNVPRIALLEKTNARYLTRDDLARHTKEEIDFIAMDVSFISATLVLPAVIRAAFPDSTSKTTAPASSPTGRGSELSSARRQIVVLVKPQFEAGRELVGKGGIIRDEAVQQAAVKKVQLALSELGATNIECIESPILGGEGNREFLLHGVFPTALTSDLPLFLYNRKFDSDLMPDSSTRAPQATIKSVAILAKPDRHELVEVLPVLEKWLHARNYEVVIDEESSAYYSAPKVIPRRELDNFAPDLALVLGGDGTLLSAARAVSRCGTLILGVNLGTLGFLTEVPLTDLYSSLEAIERGEYVIDSRSMLTCKLVRDGATLATHSALNDLVVSKSAISRLNHFELYVDGEFVSSYKADGLILATPTGSTAYSLGAGGPILKPDVQAFVVTPVSPHGLTHRPVVVRDSVQIEISVKTGEEAAYLSLDGQVGMPLQDGDRVCCVKAEHPAKLLRFQKTFFEVLSTKLKWGDR